MHDAFKGASTPDIAVANSVLSDGSFRYSVPIEVPKFRGLEPNLDLRYVSSFNGHGTPDALLGAGWKLAALSSIERVSFGGGTPVFDFNQDIFRLDGQDLLLCNDAQATSKLNFPYPAERKTNRESASCSAGGHFATYDENYLKIQLDQQLNEFHVFKKNGTKYTYRSQKVVLGVQTTPGTAEYSHLHLGRYLLSSVTDLAGHTVRYTYLGGGRANGHAPRITKISYELPSGTIVYSIFLGFDQIPADVARPRYATGTSLIGQQPFRIRSIRVFEGDGANKIRAYLLDYTVAAQTRISLLSQVQRYGADFGFDANHIPSGTPLGAPYRFTYTPDNMAVTRNFLGANAFDAVVSTLDLDQDGRQEVLVATGTGNKDLRVYQFDNYGVPSVKPVAGWLQNLYANNSWTLSWFGGGSTGSGNSIDRISRFDPTSGQTFYAYTNITRRRVGDPGEDKRIVTRTTRRAIRGITPNTADATLNVNTPIRFFGNFDRDPGLEAIVGRNVHQVNASGGLWGGYSRGSIIGTYMADIDGDGQDELFGPVGSDDTNWNYSDPNGTGWFRIKTTPNPIRPHGADAQFGFGDFNGDGAQDLVVVKPRTGSTPRIIVHLSDGDAFRTTGETWIDFHPDATFPQLSVQVRDMNGDGLADVVVTRKCNWVDAWCVRGQFQSLIYLSTGNSFHELSVGPVNDVYSTLGSKRGVVADVNGDGIGDIVGKGGNLHLFGVSGPKSVLAAITDPAGGHQTVGYVPSTHYNDNKVPRSYPVVGSITRSNGFNGQERTIDFSYVSNRFDYDRRQTVGFRTITATLPEIAGESSRPRLVTTYAQHVVSGRSDSALKGRATSRTLIRGGVTWWQEINDWGSTGLDLRPRRSWKNRTRTKTRHGQALPERTTEYHYTVFGELAQFIDLGFAGPEDDRTTWYVYNENPDKYIVEKASHKIVNAGPSFNGNNAHWLAAEFFIYDGEQHAGVTPPVLGRITEVRRLQRNNQNVAFGQTVGTFSYDSWGNVVSETDAKGRATTHSYDTGKHLFRTGTTNAAGHTVSTHWHHGCQVPLTETDVNGLVTTTTFDVHCRKIEQRSPNGHEVNWSYNAFGNPTAQYVETRSASADSGNDHPDTVSRQYFNGFGEVYKETTSGATSRIEDAIVTLSSYDKRGNLAWTSIPLTWAEAAGNTAATNQRVSFNYDTLDRVTKTTAADGKYSVREYEQTGLITSWGTNQNGYFPFVDEKNADCFDNDATTICGWTRNTFDARGNLIISGVRNTNVEPGTAWFDDTFFYFDTLDRLIAVLDPGRAQWTYTYDAVGNRRTANDPGLGLWSLSYDATDNLISQVDAKGQTIAYTYDQLDRVKTKTVSGPGLTSITTQYSYDQPRAGHNNIGMLTRAAINGTHAIEYDYNNQGLLAKERHMIDGRRYQLQTEYAANGVPLRRALPNAPGTETTAWTGPFRYDAANRLTGFGAHITGITYDLRSNPIEIVYGNGLRSVSEYSRSRGWMNRTEVRDATNQVMAKTRYVRSATGRVSQQWTSRNEGNLNYSYDYAGRLMTVVNRNGVMAFDQSFTYDAAGNMRSNSHLGTYAYAPGTHRPTTVAGQSFTYDSNGNMLQGLHGKVMTYDGENRPLSVTYAGTTTSYVYGADGTRLKRTDKTGQPDETVTVTFGGVEIRNFGQGASEEIVTYPHPDVRLVNGVASYMHRDQLNSVRLITGTDGAEDKRSIYHPFGKARDWTSDLIAAPETKGYIGERYDAGAGLQYLNARYYDPELSMFIQPDWFEVTQPGVGTNRYSYSFSDPINLSDPSGNAIDSAGSLKSDSIEEGGDGRDGNTGGGRADGVNANGAGERETAFGPEDEEYEEAQRRPGRPGQPRNPSGYLEVLREQVLKAQINAARAKLGMKPAAYAQSPGYTPSSQSNARLQRDLRQLQSAIRASRSPIWSGTKTKTPAQNAQAHYQKHKLEFPEYSNAAQYTQAARSFVSNPPKGTQSKVRPNGDTMYYNPNTNTFAVATPSGAPRTMFRPSAGRSYWENQIK
ncbi:RHS repeat-associated core domain-containing protein [Ruegeria atlantica]|uniref:RHS repeat-associated core domain-containing protein n=1 Tax=Ruegeria atlantica TaxID=81569 RepID=UPI0014805BAD